MISCSPEVLIDQRADVERTIQHAVASCLNNGVTPERVSAIQLRAAGPQAYFVHAQFAQPGGRIEAASLDAVENDESSLLQYTVTTQEPTVTYAQLRARIVEVSNNGELTEAIRLFAQQFGVQAMTASSVGPAAVTNANTEDPPNTPNHSSDSDLSDGAIAGIVVGVVLGLLIIAAIVAYSCGAFRRKAAEGQDLMPQTSSVSCRI